LPMSPRVRLVRQFYSQMYNCMVPLLALLLAAIQPAQAQEEAEAILDKANRYLSENTRYKLNVLTDAPFYLPGDEMWLQVMLVDALNHNPASIPTPVTVQLLNSDKKAIATQLLTTNRQGTAMGELPLPSGLPVGAYHLVAHTPDMLIHPERAYFFHQPIGVGGPLKNQAVASKAVADIHIRAESGSLVAGKLNQVFFGLTNAPGTGIGGSGQLLDAQGNELLKVNTIEQGELPKGMGQFSFVPKAGEKYRLKFGSMVQELPPVQQSAAKFAIAAQGKTLLLDIVASEDFEGETLWAVARAGRKLLAAKALVTKGKAGIGFDSWEFPSGIAQFFLFTPTGQLLAEQRFFLRNAAPPTASIQIRLPQVIRKSRNAFKFSQMLNGAFQVSVLSDAYETTTGAATLSAWLYLQSELQKPVKDLEKIFGLPQQQQETWANLALNCFRNRHLPMQKFTLASSEPSPWAAVMDRQRNLLGFQVLDKQTQAPLAFAKVAASVVGEEHGQLGSFTTNRNGFLALNAPEMEGWHKILLRLEAYSLKEREIVVAFSPFVQLLPDLGHLTPDLEKAAPFWQQQRALWATAEHFAHDISHPFPRPAKTFLTQVDQQLDMEQFVALPEMQEVFVEFLKGCRVRGEAGKHQIFMSDYDTEKEYTMAFFKEQPLRLLDGLPIMDSEVILEMDPADLHSIALTYGTTVYGRNRFMGVLHLHTRSRQWQRRYPNGFFEMVLYHPKTETSAPVAENQPDFRKRLHFKSWRPNTQPYFFNTSDELGKFTVRVQGITEQGLPIYVEESFEVVFEQGN